MLSLMTLNVHNAHSFVKSKRTAIFGQNALMTDDRPDAAQRLQIAREKRGFDSARAAADFFGWNYDTYIQHERGERGITRAVDRYAVAFKVSPGWLLTGEGRAPGEDTALPHRAIPAIESFEEFEARAEALMKGTEPPPTKPPVMAPYAPEPNATIESGPAYLPAKALLNHDVPELGVMVGGSGEDDSVFEFNGTTVDYHPRPPGLVHRKNVFVLRVSNSSMSPRFEDGDIEYIELKNPSVGEYVVVEEKPKTEGAAGRSFIKRLVKSDARKIVVEQFNPHGFMEFGRNEIHRLFRVITDKKELIG